MNIGEQVKKLRELANSKELEMHEPVTYGFYGKIKSKLFEAADTIEALSAKLQAANMERSDMISRNKLIEEIDKEIDGVIVKDIYSKGKNAGLRKAKILAEEQTVTHYSGGWIACEDRLPDKSGSYLVTTYSNGISQYISDIDQFVYNGMPDGYWINGEDVIAWQPLPEPYRP